MLADYAVKWLRWSWKAGQTGVTPTMTTTQKTVAVCLFYVASLAVCAFVNYSIMSHYAMKKAANKEGTDANEKVIAKQEDETSWPPKLVGEATIISAARVELLAGSVGQITIHPIGAGPIVETKESYAKIKLRITNDSKVVDFCFSAPDARPAGGVSCIVSPFAAQEQKRL